MNRFTGTSPAAGLRNLVGARSDPMRLLRGAELAERGVVTSVEIRPGELRGSVSGSRRESYTVKITTPTTGSLPGAGSPIQWNCTCPDWGDPCKHGVAVMLVAAQRLEEDSDLVAVFVGSSPQPNTEQIPEQIPEQTREQNPEQEREQNRAQRTQQSPAVTLSNRPAGLPVVAPLWAQALGEVVEATTAQQFFGDAPLGTTPTTPPSDPSIGPDRLRQLGPLIVDSYDFAPDIIRMYSGLRED
jgi:SWIM zinc finger